MNEVKLNHKPLLIVVSSPSGAGKTSVCKKLLENNNSIKMSISATTRKPRQNEIDGIDYNFISRDKFLQKIKNNQFLAVGLLRFLSGIPIQIQNLIPVLFDVNETNFRFFTYTSSSLGTSIFPSYGFISDS